MANAEQNNIVAFVAMGDGTRRGECKIMLTEHNRHNRKCYFLYRS